MILNLHFFLYFPADQVVTLGIQDLYLHEVAGVQVSRAAVKQVLVSISGASMALRPTYIRRS